MDEESAENQPTAHFLGHHPFRQAVAVPNNNPKPPNRGVQGKRGTSHLGFAPIAGYPLLPHPGFLLLSNPGAVRLRAWKVSIPQGSRAQFRVVAE
jgi:hypothetical protein